MSPYTVLVVGMGKRGMHHAAAFNANPRFKVTGICDIDLKRLEDAGARLGNPQKSNDAAALARSIKPDVFCFCTMPHLRTPFIKAGIEGGAKLLAFEKPVALTSAELFTMRDLLRKSGVKAVVSHQHRYGRHYQKVKEIVAGGALGRVHTLYGSATGWMTHMLSHLIDYTCWFNDYGPATWVMAQAAGGVKFGDNHPSPDYIAGFVQFANGARGVYEGSCSSAVGLNDWTREYIRVDCELGTAILNSREIEVFSRADLVRQRCREGQGQRIQLIAQPKWLNTWLIEKFCRWLDGGPEMETNVEANIQAVALIFAGIESQRTGQAIEIDRYIRSHG